MATKIRFNQILGAYINIFDFLSAAQIAVVQSNALTPMLTTQINAAYAAAVAAKVSLHFPGGTYPFDSQLVWGSAVGVYGEPEKTTFLKTGNFDGIMITGNDGIFSGFRVNGATGNGGMGFYLKGVSHATLKDLFIWNHASHGIYVDDTDHRLPAFHTRFDNLHVTTNGGCGIYINDAITTPGIYICNIYHFKDCSLTANSSVGFRQAGDSSAGYHTMSGCTIEQNGGGGMLIEGTRCAMSVYLESNTTYDMKLSDTSDCNFITLQASTIVFEDFGTRNVIIDMGVHAGVIFSGAFSVPARKDNTAGRAMTIGAGRAGIPTSGSSKAGGQLSLAGGDAAGNVGASAGGAAHIRGGTGVNTGEVGQVHIQINSGGTSIGTVHGCTSSTLLNLAGAAAFLSGTGASGTGVTATLTFAELDFPPFIVAQNIAVTSWVPTNYNTPSVAVTACTTTSVSYLNTTTGFTTAGNIDALAGASARVRAPLITGITTTQKNLITGIAGMIVYDSTMSTLQVFNGVTWVNLH